MIPKVEKVPGSGGEEDEINIGMEVVVDPDGPNPMTTYVEAQVNILKAFFLEMLALCSYRWPRMTWWRRRRLRRRRRVRPR